MKLKELRLDVEALASEALFGHGFLHYGYWENGEADELSLARLGQAQQAYFDVVASRIPAGTRRILDVGSGTGANALALTRLGYQVECVCPSPRLNEFARRKLPPTVPIHEARFEDLALTGPFDLVLFLESFHYLEAATALARAAALAPAALVFDYFPRRDAGGSRKVSHARFVALAQQAGFRLEEDRDCTREITPTFLVLDTLRNERLRPFVTRTVQDLRRTRPLLSLLLAWPLARALAAATRDSRKHQTFPAEFEYRLIRLARR
ncbi:MAG: class I SAM-dependent methyltransferase [Burkholderiaceae bacterium]|nr:class I SAM-dependent methyltransferase [Burkholderiaceae bacterium]